MKIAALFALALAWTPGLHAQVVVQNTNLSLVADSLGGANYRFDLYQDPAATNVTTAWLQYAKPTVQFVDMTLDEGSDWYVVTPGALFTPAQIQAGVFTKLVD